MTPQDFQKPGNKTQNGHKHIRETQQSDF